MIRMSRPIANAPAEWLKVAEGERARVIEALGVEHRAYRARRRTSGVKEEFKFAFKFEAFGDDRLRKALNHVYKCKCAYCESYFGATQPVAVEHYRPKGAVIDGDERIKPAYYWLAADWDNLLPSCTDCNSPRRQVTDSDGIPRVRGKGNHFPLEPGSTRARSPGKEKAERPLLLHPEHDDPELHLEFLTKDDRLGITRPALVKGKPSEKGKASIEVYALDRVGLVTGRLSVAKKLVSHLKNTAKYERLRHENPDFEADYQESILDLRDSYLDPSSPYLAMVRQIVSARLPNVNL